MAEYIDMNTHEILDDDDMHDRYDEWIDEVHGEVSIGDATFFPSEILRELDPIAYRVGFSDFVDFDTEDGKVMELDDSPVCEDCGEKMDRDEIVVALASHDRLMCESCDDDDDDDDDDDKCTVWGKAPNGAEVICTLEGEHTTHIAQAYDMHKVYEIAGVNWD